MKPKKRRGKSAPAKSSPEAHQVRDRRMVLLDDAPLRKRAATEYQSVMAKIEKTRAEWQLFQEVDQPEFGRWMAKTFGALLTELRETTRVLAEQRHLVDAVHAEMVWGDFRDPRKAYAEVMRERERERENPEPFDDPFFGDEAKGEGTGTGEKDPFGDDFDAEAFFESDEFWDSDEEGEPFSDMAAGTTDEERRGIFEEMLKNMVGIDPRRLSKAEYARMFAEFEEDVLGIKRDPGTPFTAAEVSAEKLAAVRIKEIYRTLVRRLHPDLKADGDAKVSAIWHDVQEAYAARDLDRLETLLALTEMAENPESRQTSLSRMRSVLKELRSALRAIQQSLRQARHDPAWKFSQNTNRSLLERRLEGELRRDLESQREELEYLNRMVEDWSRPVKKRSAKKKPAKTGKKVEAKRAPKQSERSASKPEPLDPDLYPF